MACSDVKLACCRLCRKPLASDLAECIHCGVCKPIADESCSWWHRLLLALLIVAAILTMLNYGGGHRNEGDCYYRDIGQQRNC